MPTTTEKPRKKKAPSVSTEKPRKKKRPVTEASSSAEKPRKKVTKKRPVEIVIAAPEDEPIPPQPRRYFGWIIQPFRAVLDRPVPSMEELRLSIKKRIQSALRRIDTSAREVTPIVLTVGRHAKVILLGATVLVTVGSLYISFASIDLIVDFTAKVASVLYAAGAATSAAIRSVYAAGKEYCARLVSRVRRPAHQAA